MTTVLPPGTLLQHMYLRERLQSRTPGRFIEIGPGYGDITALLLAAGWHGTVYELSPESVAFLHTRFADEIAQHRLTVMNDDFVAHTQAAASADLVISSMVIEHLSDEDERRFMEQARHVITAHGVVINMMPAGMQYWGIEDEIAGHFRRYDRTRIQQLCQRTQWQMTHVAGLTFPVSNMLLPLSNRQVQQYEGRKVQQTMLERTKESGHRTVPFKTSFPAILGIILNPIVMLPFHWLQKLTKDSSRCMILYVEATPAPRGQV
jgi:phospholipid N-methyltransferase